MKTTFPFFVMVTLALGLSGCGGGKGGVNESGIEADGRCSSNLVSDHDSASSDINGTRDVKVQANACSKFVTKYGKTLTCKTPRGGMFSAATYNTFCESIKKTAGVK